MNDQPGFISPSPELPPEHASVTTATPTSGSEPSQPTPPKIKHAHKFIFGYLALIVLVAAVAGIYTWQHKKVNSLNVQVSSLQKQIASLQKTQATATSTQATNPYAGWKTFCSSTGGLCLKYPSDWAFKQSLSATVVPESDVFTGPSGKVVVDYYPGNGIGPTGDNSTIDIVSVNSTQESDMDVVGATIKSLDNSSVGYVAQLFVADSSSDYSAGQVLNKNYWPVVPEFTNPKLDNNHANQLDVEQANSTSQQAGFSTQTQAQAWLSTSEVKTGQLILQSASYNN